MAGVGNLYKFESHCPGPKMRNQDPRGRRGQPLQEREPLPGAQDEESRKRPAWANSHKIGEPLPGAEDEESRLRPVANSSLVIHVLFGIHLFLQIFTFDEVSYLGVAMAIGSLLQLQKVTMNSAFVTFKMQNVELTTLLFDDSD